MHEHGRLINGIYAFFRSTTPGSLIEKRPQQEVGIAREDIQRCDLVAETRSTSRLLQKLKLGTGTAWIEERKGAHKNRSGNTEGRKETVEITLSKKMCLNLY